MNVLLLVAYDGTRFYGWQKTQSGPSIEGTLQTILEQILQRPIRLQASSRTDRGVHAEGQLINFCLEKQLNLHQLKKSLNQLLPPDIAVRELFKAPSENFHPTLDSIQKEYQYRICYGEVCLPHNRFTHWHYPYPLNIESMKRSIPLFCGKKSFRAFCNFRKNLNYTTYERHLESIIIKETEENCLSIYLKGNSFLYKMARNIIGTLVFIGAEKITLEEVPLIFEGKTRIHKGITAPAKGLSLKEVFF